MKTMELIFKISIEAVANEAGKVGQQRENSREREK
jgi:hypothetical protein